MTDRRSRGTPHAITHTTAHRSRSPADSWSRLDLRRTRHWRRRTDEYGSRRRSGTDKRGAFHGRPLPRVALETDCRGSFAGPPDSQQRNTDRTGARLSFAGIRAPGAGAFDVFAVRAWRLRLVHAHRRADDWKAV